MREGRVFRRCGKCRREILSGERRCSCGHGRFSWGFVVDEAPVGAPRRQRKRQGFKTRDDALSAMHALQGAAANGNVVEPSRLMVGQYLDRWLPAVRASVRPSSWRAFGGHVRLYLKPRLEHVPLQSLDRATIKAMYAALAQPRGDKPGLSAKTIHNVHLTLHRALADAVDDRIVVRNPAAGAHAAPRARREMRTWTADELRRFLTYVVDERDFALWRTAAFTGMRRGELLGLPWRSVDLDAGTITIAKALVRGPDGFADSEPKTARGRRTIDLDPATVMALRRWLVAQKAERLAAGPAWRDLGLVFARANGEPLGEIIGHRFDRLVEQSGLPRVRFHDLRHTHATLLLAAGVPAHVVSRRLGHASEAFTLMQYGHVLPGQQRDAAERMAAMVDG